MPDLSSFFSISVKKTALPAERESGIVQSIFLKESKTCTNSCSGPLESCGNSLLLSLGDPESSELGELFDRCQIKGGASGIQVGQIGAAAHSLEVAHRGPVEVEPLKFCKALEESQIDGLLVFAVDPFNIETPERRL